MPECSVCKHPKAPEVVAKVKAGTLTIEDAAKELGVSYPLMWRHLRYHEVTDQQVLSGDIDTFGLLKELVTVLKRWLDEAKQLSPTVGNARILDVVVRNMRQTLMDIETLTGRLRTAPLIQLQQVNIQYEKLTAFLLTQTCPECRKKTAEFLQTFG
jgi:hypothetical protein